MYTKKFNILKCNILILINYGYLMLIEYGFCAEYTCQSRDYCIIFSCCETNIYICKPSNNEKYILMVFK